MDPKEQDWLKAYSALKILGERKQQMATSSTSQTRQQMPDAGNSANLGQFLQNYLKLQTLQKKDIGGAQSATGMRNLQSTMDTSQQRWQQSESQFGDRGGFGGQERNQPESSSFQSHSGQYGSQSHSQGNWGNRGAGQQSQFEDRGNYGGDSSRNSKRGGIEQYDQYGRPLEKAANKALKCDLCNVDFIDENTMAKHLNGMLHISRSMNQNQSDSSSHNRMDRQGDSYGRNQQISDRQGDTYGRNQPTAARDRRGESGDDDVLIRSESGSWEQYDSLSGDKGKGILKNRREGGQGTNWQKQGIDRQSSRNQTGGQQGSNKQQIPGKQVPNLGTLDKEKYSRKCVICDVTCLSPVVWESHINGKRHKEKKMEMDMSKNTKSKNSSGATTIDRQDHEQFRLKRCEICDFTADTQLSWDVHTSGLIHAKLYQEKLNELGELRFRAQYGSIPVGAMAKQIIMHNPNAGGETKIENENQNRERGIGMDRHGMGGGSRGFDSFDASGNNRGYGGRDMEGDNRVYGSSGYDNRDMGGDKRGYDISGDRGFGSGNLGGGFDSRDMGGDSREYDQRDMGGDRKSYDNRGMSGDNRTYDRRDIGKDNSYDNRGMGGGSRDFDSRGQDTGDNMNRNSRDSHNMGGKKRGAEEDRYGRSSGQRDRMDEMQDMDYDSHGRRMDSVDDRRLDSRPDRRQEREEFYSDSRDQRSERDDWNERSIDRNVPASQPVVFDYSHRKHEDEIQDSEQEQSVQKTEKHKKSKQENQREKRRSKRSNNSMNTQQLHDKEVDELQKKALRQQLFQCVQDNPDIDINFLKNLVKSMHSLNPESGTGQQKPAETVPVQHKPVAMEIDPAAVQGPLGNMTSTEPCAASFEAPCDIGDHVKQKEDPSDSLAGISKRCIYKREKKRKARQRHRELKRQQTKPVDVLEEPCDTEDHRSEKDVHVPLVHRSAFPVVEKYDVSIISLNHSDFL